MENKHWQVLGFFFVLVFFAVFSTKINFHDVPEYITIAKNMAGVNNLDLYSTHSLLYPLIISPFLKIFPSLITIKLVNCIWIFLMGLVLFIFLKNKKAFVLFAFSPIVWYVSIQTTPILPASFFFLLAYLFFKKDDLSYHLFYSGFFLGLSYAIYDPILLVAAVFIPVYLWEKKFYVVFAYFISIGIGILPRLILDYYLFNMPIYSIIKFFGANMVVSLELNEFSLFLNFVILLIAISPFLYKLYKINFKEHKKDIVFITISGFLLLIRCGIPKYFIIIAPIIIILLSEILNEKEIKWHAIISIILIIVLTYTYFIPTNEDELINRDLKQVISENPKLDYLIAYPGNDANGFAVFSWTNKPRIIWYQDFEASINNKTQIRGYNFDFNSKIRLKDKVAISISFNRFDNRTYSNYKLITQNKSFPDGFEMDKCYRILCVSK